MYRIDPYPRETTDFDVLGDADLDSDLGPRREPYTSPSQPVQVTFNYIELSGGANVTVGVAALAPAGDLGKNNDARRARLKEFDLSEGEITRLRGPVGLYIGSKTPPEIAVAILAEMTAVRHGVSEPSWAAKKDARFDPSACEVKT